MLEVIVRLHDANVSPTRPSRELATLRIFNDGTGDIFTGHYVVRVRDENGEDQDMGVFDHPREAGVLECVRRAIEALP